MEKLQAVARELKLAPGAVVQTDVTKPEQVKRLVDQAVRLHGLCRHETCRAGDLRWSAAGGEVVQHTQHHHLARYVATELLESITAPDIAAIMRQHYEGAVPADAFARIVAFAISQPDDLDINEVLLRPTSQEY